MQENQIQKILVRHLRSLGVLFLAPMNEVGARNSAERERAARYVFEMGGLRGAPDLMILDRPPNGGDRARGAALELKTPKGSLSREQRRVLSHFRERGWLVYVVDSVEKGKEALRDMGFVSGWKRFKKSN